MDSATPTESRELSKVPTPSGKGPTAPTFVRIWLARVLTALHVSIVFVFVIGWALPWHSALVAVMVAAVVVQSGWWFFGDTCVLTLLEQKLRGAPRPDDRGRAHLPEAPPNFLLETATRMLGRPASARVVDALARIVMWGAFAIAALRLALESWRLS